jgi:UDP-N-acetylmuramoyl-tripeptide--D-alanyl-D-alanine ligase
MSLNANDVMKAGRGRMPVGQPSTPIRGVTVDSRDVPEGALFVGLRGETTDGGQYAAAALRAGAAAAVVGESQWMWIEGEAQALGKPVIVTPDPLAVLQAAGRLALERLGAQVIGITGSTGKTTTKDILLAMLRAAGVRAEGTRGNQNTEVGVPMSLLNLPDDTEVAVVEMGMRGTGQIAELAALAPPDVACITTIAPVHLELLRSMENIAAAKAELLEALRDGGVAVVPADEPLLEPHIQALGPGVEVRRFSADAELDLDIDLPIAWQRTNAAAALECCRAIGRAPAPGTRVEVELSGMRGHERSLESGGLLIEDCYNANPLAMAAALEDLASRPPRRVAVLGDMMELGTDQERYHREVGRMVAELGIELLVAVGERAGWYAQEADGVPAARFADAQEAAAGIAEHLEPGDTVLLKGSRSMELERVGAVLD